MLIWPYYRSSSLCETSTTASKVDARDRPNFRVYFSKGHVGFISITLAIAKEPCQGNPASTCWDRSRSCIARGCSVGWGRRPRSGPGRSEGELPTGGRDKLAAIRNRCLCAVYYGYVNFMFAIGFMHVSASSYENPDSYSQLSMFQTTGKKNRAGGRAGKEIVQLLACA